MATSETDKEWGGRDPREWACALRRIDAEQARAIKGNLTVLNKASVKEFHPAQQVPSGGLQYEVASRASLAKMTQRVSRTLWTRLLASSP